MQYLACILCIEEQHLTEEMTAPEGPKNQVDGLQRDTIQLLHATQAIHTHSPSHLVELAVHARKDQHSQNRSWNVLTTPWDHE